MPPSAERRAFRGAVLAGGSSRRMGTDKAFVEVGGVPMVTVAVEALVAAGAERVHVVGGDRERHQALGLSWLPDTHPGDGPLGGIIDAIRAEDTPELVVVVACDHPNASPLAVSSLVGAVGGADGAVPVVEGRTQWMHAAWHRRVLPVLEAAFAAGIRSPKRATEALDLVRVLDGSPCWYADADSPEDLAAITSQDDDHRT